jgi:flavin-dependent dehydrogenase
MMQTNTFDVIVIGSGPAGCAAASIGKKAGLNVLVVTNEPDPDEKAVPAPEELESIHPGVSSLLAKIGVEGAEHKATYGQYSGIFAANVYTPLGQDEGGVWQGLHIHREIFNADLVRKARTAGIAVKFNERVEDFILMDQRIIGIKTSSADYYATYIIDASGKKAIAGKKLNLKQKFFSPPLVCWTGISGGIDSYPFDPTAAHFIGDPHGWTWFAPQPPHHCAWTRLSTQGEKSFLPPDALKAYPVIGKIQTGNMRWRMYYPVCREGIVLCGDAAGILDPAAGQGIFNALWSGIKAAEAVVSCLKQPQLEAFHLAHYNEWFVQQFETKVQQLQQYYEEKVPGIYMKF